MIEALAEIKNERAMTNLLLENIERHLAQINGSTTRHFEDDRRQFGLTEAWQRAHEEREAEARGLAAGRAQTLNWLDKAMLRYFIPISLFVMATWAFVVK